MPKIETLSWRELYFDSQNPRVMNPDEAAEKALDDLVEQVKEEIYELAKSVAKHGFLPINNFIVTEETDGTLIARDGNRRLAVLHLLSSSALATQYYSKNRVKSLQKLLGDKQLPEKVMCVLYPEGLAEEAVEAMALQHMGTQKGAGHLPWASEGKDNFARRFRGEKGRYWKTDLVIKWLRGLDRLQEVDVKNITTIERLFAQDFLDRVGLKFKARHKEPSLFISKQFNELDVANVIEQLVVQISDSSIRVDDIKTKKIRAQFFADERWKDIWPERNQHKPESYDQIHTMDAEREKLEDDTSRSFDKDLVQPKEQAQMSIEGVSEGSKIASTPTRLRRQRKRKYIAPKSFELTRSQKPELQAIYSLVEELKKVPHNDAPTLGVMGIRSVLDKLAILVLAAETSPKEKVDTGPLIDRVRKMAKILNDVPLRSLAGKKGEALIESIKEVEIESMHAVTHNPFVYGTSDSVRRFWDRAEEIIRLAYEYYDEKS